MSLLTEASLIVTPNGYNVGKLYSVVPNTTLGDMDVVRATSATRVNSAGLIEIARTNLVLYSEQFDNASWQKVGGGIASAPVVTPNVETAPDGTMTADRVFFTLNGGTSSLDLSSLGSNAFTFTSLTRTQSVYIKTTDGTTRNFSFVSPTGISTSITVTSVYQRFTFTVPNGTIVSSTIRLRLRGSASGEGTATSATIAIWGAQYEEGSVATEYIPTVASIRTKFAGITQDGSVAQNIPRLDYTGGGCPSILAEPARTNLVFYSEQFDNTYWNKSNVTVTANTTTAPDGTMTADNLNITATNGFLRRSSLTFANSTSYTISIFVKKSATTGTKNFRFYYNNNESSPINSSFTCLVDLTNITATTTASGTIPPTILSTRLVNYNNNWYRVEVAFTTSSLGGNATSEIGLQPPSGGPVVDFDAWGAQLEAGAYATSYIPTTTATVTRNGDQISRANLFTNGIVTASGGTWFMEIRNNLVYTRDNSNVNINLDDSSGFNNGFLLRNTGTGRLSIQKTILGSATFLYLTTTDLTKIAIKWNGVTADVFANGVKVVSATAFTTTNLQTILTQMQVPVFINLMALFPTPLTDTQCTQLTTP